MTWRSPEHAGAEAALDFLVGAEISAERSPWLDALLGKVREFTRLLAKAPRGTRSLVTLIRAR